MNLFYYIWISRLLCFFLFCLNIAHVLGYDQIPIDSMQGLEIGSGFGMDMDIGDTEGAGAASADLSFPEPPHDNNNVAAWYDTDL